MKSLAHREYHRIYSRIWRKNHPHYGRNWNRLHRNTRVTDITLPNQNKVRVKLIKNKLVKSKEDYIQKKKGHCDNCTILLTSKYAIGHNGATCGQCLHRLSTVVLK